MARDKRRHSAAKAGDARSWSAIDRDRVLHTSAFRRLDSVTQVVAPEEGHVFHNRLTHSMKVGQVARRIAEKVAKGLKDEKLKPDPEVAEAAGFAHDLGHPPFGHAAETALDDLVTAEGLSDGYEGNAQTFRIVTKLAVRTHKHLGLDLTRATLSAVLKYPWYRAAKEGKDVIERDGGRLDKHKKWGAYRTEEQDFEFCRRGGPPGDARSIEAQCMELADDIAYSIHDAEDFYRAGIVPLDRLAASDDGLSPEAERFLKRAFDRSGTTGKTQQKLADAFKVAMAACAVAESYRGTYHHRAKLRMWTSDQIQDLVNGINVTEKSGQVLLSLPENLRNRIEILKELTWVYVILNPRLATQQVGHRRIVEELFEDYLDAVKKKKRHVLPGRFADQPAGTSKELYAGLSPAKRRVRLVADIVSSMTDQEALMLHRRLRGTAPGSALDGRVL
ncbi:MAG: dNTP triphosphohydrolase [Myxococcales bacterium]|nr:dNTP triphosphohydrolase [Myxococcales bacterium]